MAHEKDRREVFLCPSIQIPMDDAHPRSRRHFLNQVQVDEPPDASSNAVPPLHVGYHVSDRAAVCGVTSTTEFACSTGLNIKISLNFPHSPPEADLCVKSITPNRWLPWNAAVQPSSTENPGIGESATGPYFGRSRHYLV
jgi:hypothetical protein